MYHTGAEIRKLKQEIRDIDEKLSVVKGSLLTKLPLNQFLNLSSYYHNLLNDKNLLKDKIKHLVDKR